MPISLGSRSQRRSMPPSGKLKRSDRPTRLRGKRRKRRPRSPLHNGRPELPNRRDWTPNAKLPGHGKRKRARRRSLSGRRRQKPQGNKLRRRPRENRPRQRPRENRPRQRPRENRPRQRPRENRPRQRPRENRPR